MRLVCLGFGYCAAHVLAMGAIGHASVAATARNAETLDSLSAQGITPLDIAAGLSAPFVAAVAEADVLLVSAPPGEAGDPFVAGVAESLRGGRAPLIVYLSTVGVYGDHDGRWVDETTPPVPESRRSRQRLAAELAWQELGLSTGAAVAILRLPGIYGPGRNALEQLRAGTARRIDKPGQVFNRVHVTDIGHAISAAVRMRANGVYNITDDEPCPPQEVIAFAAGLLGLAPPPLVPFDQASLSPMGRSFYGENKRVSNAHAKARLGWRLQFPTYREGLRALAAAAGAA